MQYFHTSRHLKFPPGHSITKLYITDYLQLPALSKIPVTGTPKSFFFLKIILKYWMRTFHYRKNFISMGFNLVIHLHKIPSGKSWLLYCLGGRNSFFKWFSRPAVFKIERLSFVSIQGMVLSLVMYCQHLLNACPGRAEYLQCNSEISKGTVIQGTEKPQKQIHQQHALTLPDDRMHSANFHHNLSENQSCHFLESYKTLKNLHIVLSLKSSTVGKK